MALTAMSGPRRGLVLCGFVALQASCSFVFVKAPPSSRRPILPDEEGTAAAPVEPPCTRWDAPWILDEVAAGTGIAMGTIDAIGTPPSNQTSEEIASRRRFAEAMFVGGFLGAAVAGVSAIWGFHTTHVCRRYLRRRGMPSNAWPWTKSLPPLVDPLHPSARD